MRLTPNYLVAITLVSIGGGIMLGLYGLTRPEPNAESLASALLTAGAVFFAVYQYLRNNEDTKSKFFLEEAVKGLGDAEALLEKTQQFDRVTWVLAARILSRVRKITEQISIPAHRSVLEIYEDKFRNKFSKALLVGVEGCGQSFYGASPLYASSLDDANREVCDKFEPTWLPENVLKEIYRFSDSADYQNTLTDKFDDSDLVRISWFFPSLHDYVLHLRANPPVTNVRVRSVSNNVSKDLVQEGRGADFVSSP